MSARQKQSSAAPRVPHSALWLGAGMDDITGPAAEAGMFGYAQAKQTTSGIHMRLRARAFAFAYDASDLCGNADDDGHDMAPLDMQRCVYVVADLGMVSEWVTQSVLARLAQHPKLPRGAYTRSNVMISATHTHCAPGGLSHHVLYSLHPPLRGADRQFLECVVHGIVGAIVRAHANLQRGVIRVATGECAGAAVNRSIDAYLANPADERRRYSDSTDTKMTLWRLDGINGFPIGMINWFAVHPTSMGSWFTLITGDNKGLAAHQFEQEHGTHHLVDRPRAFVAAFAQTNSGDVSPNIHGPRDESTQQHDFERMKVVANAQLDAARRLYAEARSATPLAGSIQCVQQYVEYGNVQLTDRWHVYKHECPSTTSSGCIGVSMMGGTTFDGRGIKHIPEGLAWGINYPKITTMPALQALQREKPVIFPTARYGMSPTVLPLQLFVIAGQLPVAAVPFEMTTMAGRRLRSTLQGTFAELRYRLYEPVLSCLSNAYSGYLTTREEYAVQRYEGASTHFGPNQLCATQQQFEMLAHVICGSSKAIYSTLPAPKIGGLGAVDFNVPVVHDGLMPNAEYGGVINDALEAYTIGSKVSVEFHGAHPKNDFRTRGTFLEVHRWIESSSRAGGMWVMHADDGDPNTFFQWRRRGTFASAITLEWLIPVATPCGKYRMKVNGDWKDFISGNISSYCGYSSPFDVVKSHDIM